MTLQAAQSERWAVLKALRSWDREMWAFGFFLAHLVAVGALALSNLFLGAALALVLSDRQLRARLRSPSPLIWWVVAYWGSLVLATLASRDLSASYGHLGETFSLATLVLVPVFLSSERRARRMVDAMILTGVVLAALGLLQLGFGFGDLDRRIRGPFSHYMTFSGVLLLSGMLLLARQLTRRSGIDTGSAHPWLHQRLLGGLGLLVLGTALVASLTRSAWLAAAGTGVALLAAVDWRRLWVVPLLVAVSLILAPVSTLVRAVSIFDLEEVSNYDRLCMAWSGLKMLAHRPILGLGPGEVKREYPMYRHPTAPRRTVPHLHNSYLQLAAERGLVGLGAFLLLMGSSLWRAWQGWKRHQNLGAVADRYLGATAALLAALAAACFEDNWGDTEVQRYWLAVLGLAWVGPAREGREVV